MPSGVGWPSSKLSWPRADRSLRKKVIGVSVEFVDLRLPIGAPGVLALGGWLKNTVCTVRGKQAWVSSVASDLDGVAACKALEATVAHLCAAQNCTASIVAHDLHPGASTRLAQRIAEQRGVPALAYSIITRTLRRSAPNTGWYSPVLGLAMDGLGLGSDGQAWGANCCVSRVLLFSASAIWSPCACLAAIARHARLGEWAPRRSTCLGRNAQISSRFSTQPAADTVAKMLLRDFNCPPTSSLGRLFDAAAGLLGICPLQSCEGEAGRALQALAEHHGEVVRAGRGLPVCRNLDFRPLLAALADGMEAGRGAACIPRHARGRFG